MGIVRGRQKKKTYQYLYLRKLNRFFRCYFFKLFLITLLVKNKSYVQFIKMSLGIPKMSLAAIVGTYIYNNRVFSPIFIYEK